MSITCIHHKLNEQAIKRGNDVYYKANQFSVNKLAAARIRSRYLFECIDVYLADCSDVALKWAWDDLDEVLYLMKHAGYTQVENKDSNGYTRITDEMKQQALSYPIGSLIPITNGKALAFCHNDTRPSLSLKDNKLTCFVCNKRFSPIDILIQRDGYKYNDAVRNLCH